MVMTTIFFLIIFCDAKFSTDVKTVAFFSEIEVSTVIHFSFFPPFHFQNMRMLLGAAGK